MQLRDRDEGSSSGSKGYSTQSCQAPAAVLRAPRGIFRWARFVNFFLEETLEIPLYQSSPFFNSFGHNLSDLQVRLKLGSD